MRRSVGERPVRSRTDERNGSYRETAPTSAGAHEALPYPECEARQGESGGLLR
jgi:hypothetical protein